MDDAAWLLLRDACLRGMCDPTDAMPVLVERGYARETPRGLAPTNEGRTALQEWARLLVGSEEEAIARRTYDTFLPLDREFKQLAADWQAAGAAKKATLLPEEWKLIDRLTTLHERASPSLRRLGDAVPRFTDYRPRLRVAVEKLEAGAHDYFTGLLVDSYHTVWWHLHQDLLWALGIDRADDPNQ